MKDNHEAQHTSRMSNKCAIGSIDGIIFKDKDKGHKGHKDKGHVSETSSYDLRRPMKESKEGIRLMSERKTKQFDSVAWLLQASIPFGRCATAGGCCNIHPPMPLG